MAVTVESSRSTRSAAPGTEIRFGRGSAAVPVDLVLSDDRHLHACAGSITVTAEGWILTNLGSHLTLRLRDRSSADIGGAHIDLAPARSVFCPWSDAEIEITIRGDGGIQTFSIAVRSDVDSSTTTPSLSDGATEYATTIDRTRTYFLVLVELCRPRLEDAMSTAVPDAKSIARRLGMSTRAVEKQIEYLRRKYGFGPDREFEDSAAGREVRGTQQLIVDIALRVGDVRIDDLETHPAAP